MDNRQKQIDAAKDLVRASYTDGVYTGEETLTPHTLSLAAALKRLDPAFNAAVHRRSARERCGIAMVNPSAPPEDTEIAILRDNGEEYRISASDLADALESSLWWSVVRHSPNG